MPPKAIEVESLTRVFGKIRAIDEVSFSVSRGEVVGFLGPNGAGKTTTMRILCGLLEATSGKARICGAPVSREPFEVKRRIGYMAENNPLPEDMRVLEYLRMRARLKEVPRRHLKERVDTAMELCDLNRKARRRIIGTLSKGFRQRVGIADAVLAEPEVVLMDEPTIGLDPHQILGIRQLLDSLRGRMTVILSSHILPEIEMACDRVIIINRGRIVASGTSTELREQFVNTCNFRLVVSGDCEELRKALHSMDAAIKVCAITDPDADGYRTVIVTAPNAAALGERFINDLPGRNGWRFREVAHLQPTLEDIFLAATRRSWDEVNGVPDANGDRKRVPRRTGAYADTPGPWKIPEPPKPKKKSETAAVTDGAASTAESAETEDATVANKP